MEKSHFLESQGHDINGSEWSGHSYADIVGFGRDIKDAEVKRG